MKVGCSRGRKTGRMVVVKVGTGVYILASQKNPPPQKKFFPVFVDIFAVI